MHGMSWAEDVTPSVKPPNGSALRELFQETPHLDWTPAARHFRMQKARIKFANSPPGSSCTTGVIIGHGRAASPRPAPRNVPEGNGFLSEEPCTQLPIQLMQPSPSALSLVMILSSFQHTSNNRIRVVSGAAVSQPIEIQASKEHGDGWSSPRSITDLGLGLGRLPALSLFPSFSR